MNQRVLHTLEYDTILEMLRSHVASDMGREEAAALRPVSELAEAERLLAQTAEAESVYRRTGRTPIEGFPDIRAMLQRIHAALALSAGELLQVGQCLRACRSARA